MTVVPQSYTSFKCETVIKHLSVALKLISGYIEKKVFTCQEKKKKTCCRIIGVGSNVLCSVNTSLYLFDVCQYIS